MPKNSRQSGSSAVPATKGKGKGRNHVQNPQIPSKNSNPPRGRPARASNSRPSDAIETAAPAKRGGNKRRRSRDDEEDLEEDPHQPGPSRQASAPLKKARTINLELPSDESADEESEDDLAAPILKARTRKVPYNMVASKWVNLSEVQLRDAQAIIESATRPVLMGFRNEKARADAQSVLNQISEKFKRRMTRFPVPQCKDIAFNFEKLYDENRKLEAMVQPSLMQIGELQSAIESEKAALERDKQQLETLKKNARDEETARKIQARKMHPSLRKSTNDGDQADRDSTLFRVLEEKSTNSKVDAFTITDDKRLLSTVRKLQNHVVSMQGNRAGLGLVPEQMRITRAVVDDVVHKMKDNKYDEMKGLLLAPIVRQSQNVQ